MAQYAERIKEVRGRILYVLKRVYPNPRTAFSLFTTLLKIFSDLDEGDFRKDVAYLLEKGYIGRVETDEERHPAATSLRERWYRLTAAGVEIIDQVIDDPALEV